MANHKSAEKRNRQAQTRRLRNRMNRKRMKTMIGKLETILEDGSAEEVKEMLRETTSVIAKTAQKGTIHKNTASRKISRLTKRVNSKVASA